MGLTPKLYEFGMPMLLGLIALVVIYWVFKASRDPTVDFNAIRLIMSRQRDGTWKESRRAVGELTAIVVSTWGFVYLVLADKLTEWYMTAWLGILLGWSVAKKLTEVKQGNGAQP